MGGKKAVIPLAPRTARAIDLAIGERIGGRIFLTAAGERLDQHGARRIVRRVARRAGLAKKIGPHTLRHAFITAAQMSGVALRTCRTRPTPAADWAVMLLLTPGRAMPTSTRATAIARSGVGTGHCMFIILTRKVARRRRSIYLADPRRPSPVATVQGGNGVMEWTKRGVIVISVAEQIGEAAMSAPSTRPARQGPRGRTAPLMSRPRPTWACRLATVSAETARDGSVASAAARLVIGKTSRIRSGWLGWSALACGLALLAGCGTQPGQQAHSASPPAATSPSSAGHTPRATAADGSFSVAVPAGWRASNPGNLGSVTLLDVVGPAAHGFQASVNVNDAGGQYQTLAGIRAAEAKLTGELRSKLGATKISAFAKTTVAGEPALTLTYRAIGIGGHPYAVTQILADHRNRTYVITLSSSPGAAVGLEPTFRALLASWRWRT